MNLNLAGVFKPVAFSTVVVSVWLVGCDTGPTQSSPQPIETQPPQPPLEILKGSGRDDGKKKEELAAQGGVPREGSTPAPATTNSKGWNARASKKRSFANENGGGRRRNPVPGNQQQSQSQRASRKRPRLSVELAGATAMPQTLPTGTAMGFSVEYEVSGDVSAVERQVVWVIETANDKRAAIPVRLEQEGSLATFAPGIKSAHGPFQCFLAIVSPDGRPVKISKKVTLQAP